MMGPLVVAGVMVDDDAALRELGVRDSKEISPVRRTELAEAIRSIAEVSIIIIDAEGIDIGRRDKTLNVLEAEAFAKVISALGPRIAYVDSADVNEARFALIIGNLIDRPVHIVSEHRADQNHPVVSAASIVAKTVRDLMMAEIAEEIGADVGSGYPSDPKTRCFLEAWLSEHGDLPPHTRRSWETARRMLGASLTRSLTE